MQFTVYLFPPSGHDQPLDYALITALRELGIGFQISFYPREDYLHDSTDVTTKSSDLSHKPTQ